MRARTGLVVGALLLTTAAPALAEDGQRRRQARPITPATCEMTLGGTFDPRTRTCQAPTDGETGENLTGSGRTVGPDRVTKISTGGDVTVAGDVKQIKDHEKARLRNKPVKDTLEV